VLSSAAPFGAESAQTCAPRRVTLDAGGGWKGNLLPTPGGEAGRWPREGRTEWT
jgi:hypothetical protein